MKNFKRALVIFSLGLLLMSGCGAGAGNSSDVTDKMEKQDLKLACQINENKANSKDNRYLTYDGHKWQNNTINWWYNPINQFYSTDDTLQTIKKAMNSWESVCGIKFNYQGITYQSPSNTQNDKFVISWVDNYTLTRWVGEEVGGSASVWTSDGYMSDAEVFLNYSQFHSNVTLYQLQGLLTHELGHVLGIAHSNVEGAVMSGKSSGTKYLPWAEQAELKNDDIRAAKSLYPIEQIEQHDDFTIRDGQVKSARWSSSDTLSSYRANSYEKSYHFTLNSRAKVQISLSSSVDTYLYLVDSYGNIIDENDDFDGTNSKIETTLYSGTYTIIATTYSGDETGSFSLEYKILQNDNPQPSINQYYGAFAYSRSTGIWGIGYRYNTEYQAKQTAVSYCNRSDCSVLQVIRADECMSYAATPNDGGYWSVSTNKTTARNIALYDCNSNMSDSCSVQFTICANGR